MKSLEQARLYLLKAAEDEALLDEVLTSSRVSDGVIGFHCQQAVEKLLKAYLSFLGVRFRKTHDLRELMDLLEDQGYKLPERFQDLDQMTPYAVEFRYGLLASAEDAPLDRHATRRLVQELRGWVEQELL